MSGWKPRILQSLGLLRFEIIPRLVGHSGTAVTERVYRHQIRPVVEEAATELL